MIDQLLDWVKFVGIVERMSSWRREEMINDIEIIDCVLCYSYDNERHICMAGGECFTDKTEIRDILIKTIKNFNEANPYYRIDLK